MLDGLRKAGNSLIGRIIMALVMGFISLSFAVWGMGNIFNGFGANTVAKVGGIEITTDDYRNAYQNTLQRLQQQAGRAITNDEARARGVDAQVLAKLVTDALLDERANALGLAMSSDDVAKYVVSDPAFAGPDGKFDPTAFEEILRDNGFTEQSFAREQRNVYLRRDIATAVAGDITVPKAALDALHRFSDETRSLDYFVLPEKAAGTIPAPTQQQLQKYFNDRRPEYRAPEYRKLVVLAVTPKSVADPNTVSDADARALYEKVKSQRYSTPEKRDVQQIVFPSLDEAKAAAAKIKAGASFAAIAAERKLTEKDIDLGVVAKSDLLEKSVADASFTLPDGAVSSPVKTSFGFALVRVTKIIPGSVKRFADVAETLKKDIAEEHIKTKIDSIHDKIEDERTSGKTLTEAAKSVGLKVTTIEAVDATGHDKKGAAVNLPDSGGLLRAAFASDIGVDNDALSTPDGGYVWFEVDGIDPAHNRTLSEVKDKVIKQWHDDKVLDVLSTKAADLVKKINAGQSIETVAVAAGGSPVAHMNDAKRSGAGSLPPGAVAQIFNVPVGTASSAEGTGLTRVVFKVLDSVVPPRDPNSAESKTDEQQLKEAYGNDILGEYLNKLQTDTGVTVNKTALNNAIGTGGSSGADY